MTRSSVLVYIADMGSLGGIIQGTLKTAISLAGALVAIQIAALGYEIVKRQQTRENYVLINEKIEAALNPIIDTAIILNKMDVALMLSNHINKPIIEQYLEAVPSIHEMLDQPLLDEHFQYLKYKKEISLLLSELIVALEKIYRNSYS